LSAFKDDIFPIEQNSQQFKIVQLQRAEVWQAGVDPIHDVQIKYDPVGGILFKK